MKVTLVAKKAFKACFVTSADLLCIQIKNISEGILFDQVPQKLHDREEDSDSLQ
jgi:hypothetical protein